MRPFVRRPRALLSRVRSRRASRLIARLRQRIAGVDGPVVLLLDGRAENNVSSWVKAFGAARVIILAAHDPVVHVGVRCVVVARRREIDEQLALLGACAIIVDEVAADPDKQLARWVKFGLHVNLGGLYVVRETVSPEAWQAEVAALGDEVDGRTRGFMKGSASQLEPVDGHLLLPKVRRHVLLVNDRTADAILPARNPDLRITTLTSRPAEVVTSGLRVFSHGAEHVLVPEVPFEAPPLTCRWYQGELETRPQLLTMSGATALPPSFRHAWADRPGNHALRRSGGHFAELRDTRVAAPLAGDYFDLNAALPGHFGHVMTESIGRLWAWDEARAAIPGIRGLYRMPDGAARPTFESQLFEAYGLAPDDVYWATSDLALESYVSATIPWHNGVPYHFHPEVRQVWQRLRSALVAPGQATPERIFVSRGHCDRGCRNQPELETWFAAHGFAVVYPERLTLEEQATLFANARVVAGFAGSALFNLLFSQGLERLIVLTHAQYSARNEWLFGVCLADELHYFWSEPDTVAGVGIRNAESFHSSWSFDFQRYGAELDEAVR